MKRVYIFGVIIALLVTAGCAGGTKTDINGFSAVEDLHADSVAIHEILKPRRATVSGDKMLFQTHIGDSLVYVYQLPEVRFLYAGVRIGGGPGEISNRYPELLPRREKGGNFSLLCHHRLYNFAATDSGVVYQGEKNLFQRDFTETIAFDTDSTTIWEDVDFSTYKTYLYLYDLRIGTPLDSVPSRSVFYEERNSGNFENASWGIQEGNMYAAVYAGTGRVEFYDISSGKFIFKKAWGNDMPVEELKNIDFSNREEGTDYFSCRSDGKYLYILGTNYILKDRKKITTQSYVMVYDWDGNPVKKYRLDKPITEILVGIDKLYGYDTSFDFEKLYVYDLKI